jgi:hypothetical protein
MLADGRGKGSGMLVWERKLRIIIVIGWISENSQKFTFTFTFTAFGTIFEDM